MGALTSMGDQGLGGKMGLGQTGNAALGYMFDPANVTKMFGHNTGPGAFMDPKGTGGGLFPGVSLGHYGINADLLGGLMGGGKGGGGQAASPAKSGQSGSVPALVSSQPMTDQNSSKGGGQSQQLAELLKMLRGH